MSEWRDTEIGLIHKDFVPYKIGEIALKMADAPFGTSIKNYDYTPKGVVVVQGNNIAGRKSDWSNLRFVSDEKYTSLPRSQCFVGDLIFPKVGTIGKVGILTPYNNFGKYLLSTNTMMLRVSPGLADQNFVYYYFFSERIKDYIELINPNSVQPVFNFTSLKNFPIYLPPLPEQQAIAEVLSSLDDKIDLLHRQNKTLEALAETLFRQWFVEEAEESWKTTCFSKHTEAFRGLSYKGSGLADEHTGLPMHNLNSVYEGGGYKYEGIKYYNGEFKERHTVKAHDIIVANTEQGHEFRLIGFPAIVPSFFGEFGLFSQHIYKLSVLKNSYLTNQFLYYLIMTPKVRELIIGSTNGSTVNMLAIDGLQVTEFQLPPEEKVERFSSIVSDYWKKKDVNQNQIRSLTTLRDTLLPKLMSGEVRVKIAEAETAIASQ